MKTIILKTLTFIVLFMASSIGSSFAECTEVILVKAPVILVDENPIGDRMPPRPIQCTISYDGIFIQGYDASNILSYEVYDIHGRQLLETINQEEFISYILNNRIGLEIRFLLSGFRLSGYI